MLFSWLFFDSINSLQRIFSMCMLRNGSFFSIFSASCFIMLVNKMLANLAYPSESMGGLLWNSVTDGMTLCLKP